MIQLIMYSFVIIYGDMTDNRSSKVIQIGVIYMDKRRLETAELLLSQKDTPFDVIKIDRGFLQDFMGSGRGC